MLFTRFFRRIIIKTGILLHQANKDIADATLPRFGNIPNDLTIELPRRIINPEHVFLGDNIRIGPGSCLNAITHYPPRSWLNNPQKDFNSQNFSPRITIGNRVTATANLQISSVSEVTIEDDVMFASSINITDGLHGYENANVPYKYQQIFRITPIRIKRGSWIGQNVVILPGVTIGELSIIGANSVVTRNIPDRCIAVGAPAKVIKKWDNANQKWLTTNGK